MPYFPHLKRAIDLLAAFPSLLLLSGPFFLISIIICVESEGSPFFFQKRVGKDWKRFRLIKFRSMRVERKAPTKQFEAGDSSRVTRIGRFLRKTKIDELPELFNVVFGHMSIVGPRPEVEKYVKGYQEDYQVILKVRPGLSDLASIKYRNEEELLANAEDPERLYVEKILPDKLCLAKEYIRQVSFKTDVEIILATIKTIFQRRQRR